MVLVVLASEVAECENTFCSEMPGVLKTFGVINA